MPPRGPLRRSAAANAGVALALLLVGATGLAQGLFLGDHYLPKALMGFAVVLVLLVLLLPAHEPHRRLGPASQVTLLRAVLTALLFGLIGEGSSAAVLWTACAVAMLAEALDGVDGWLARRGGWVSPFGARFDMEIDALLVMVLALLVWSLDRAGAWVLAAGLLRYAFLAAGMAWSAMRRPLPPSRRRQAVCVIQVLSLVLALIPVFPVSLSVVFAGAGLVVLCYSFAVDTLWLARRAGRPLATGESP
jgi:phosphatidylglycerophosphate synthase